jgi:hypothetical protein
MRTYNHVCGGAKLDGSMFRDLVRLKWRIVLGKDIKAEVVERYIQGREVAVEMHGNKKEAIKLALIR